MVSRSAMRHLVQSGLESRVAECGGGGEYLGLYEVDVGADGGAVHEVDGTPVGEDVEVVASDLVSSQLGSDGSAFVEVIKAAEFEFVLGGGHRSEVRAVAQGGEILVPEGEIASGAEDEFRVVDGLGGGRAGAEAEGVRLYPLDRVVVVHGDAQVLGAQGLRNGAADLAEADDAGAAAREDVPRARTRASVENTMDRPTRWSSQSLSGERATDTTGHGSEPRAAYRWCPFSVSSTTPRMRPENLFTRVWRLAAK